MKFGLIYELQLPAPNHDDDVTQKFRDALFLPSGQSR
jgi:hypothetical protein